MARNLNVYPKVHLSGSTWLVRVKIQDDAGNAEVIEHSEPSSVPGEASDQEGGQLLLLKLVVEMTVADTDTFQDVADAFLVDDIRPGPQTETVWGNWRDEAESILAGMAQPYTMSEFYAEWSKQATQQIRQDARRALVTQRGWTVTHVKQSEGDGSSTIEVG